MMTTAIEVVATGLQFPEGPSVAPNGDLYIVELAGRRVSKIDALGARTTIATLGGSPNGSAFGPDQKLYVCNGGGRWAAETCTGGLAGTGDSQGLVQRVGSDGRFHTLISEIDGVALNSPNDLCFDRDGGFWFTDPVWPDATGHVPAGTVCWSDTDGHAVRAHVGLRFPNGVAVSPEGSALIVAVSQAHTLVEFPIHGPGRLGEPRTFATLETGYPDGLCFDADSRLYCAGHGASAVYVYPPDGGAPVEVIQFEDRDVTNMCFAGDDLQWLYVTESDQGRLVRRRRARPGMALFPDRVWTR